VHLKDSHGAEVATVWANKAGNTLEIEYAEVRTDARGQGVYKHLLQRLAEQFNVILDLPHNNAAKRTYLELGAREQRDGRLVIDRRPVAAPNVFGEPTDSSPSLDL